MITLHINLSKQVLYLYRNDTLLYTCPISSGAAGIGSEPGSGKTPIGKFIISDKIGHQAPENAIFISRQIAGLYPSDIPAGMDENSDYILTRILWLDGTEPHNDNTHERYIYLHGTNRTDLLGTPASHGCIRLAPKDILHIFDLVPVYTPVTITK